MTRSWVGIWAVLLGAGMAGAQTSAPQAQPQVLQLPPAMSQQVPTGQVPTIQAHARAVLVDVVVTDGHGHAVHGLKKGDFQVVEDGQPQTIASFEEIQPKTPEERAKLADVKLPVNTFTNAHKVQETGAATVLLLDGMDSPLMAQAYARDQLLKYLATANPTGPIAIFELDTTLHLVQGFTSDIEVLRAAVKDRAKLLQTVIPRTPGYVATRFRYDALTHGMQDLGRYLAQYPGRKNLIWFTGSVPVFTYDDGSGLGGSLRDSESFAFDYSTTTDVLTLGRVSVYPVDTEGLRTNPAFSAANGGRISPGSINAFATREFYKHTDLDDVAAATGGKAFYNTNGITEAINEVVETGANYYTISYYPTNKNWDGSYRKLKLDLAVQGDKLEYRRGYYAQRETGLAKATAPPPPGSRRQITNHAPPPEDQFVNAMQLGAIDPGTIVFTAQVSGKPDVEKIAKGAPLPPENFLKPQYRDKPFREYVVDYVVNGKQLQLTPTPKGTLQGAVEFVLLVLDDKGALVNSATAQVQMNVTPATYKYMLTNGVAMPVKIQVPVKGNYFLRAGVHDTESGRGGALEVAVGEIKVDGLK